MLRQRHTVQTRQANMMTGGIRSIRIPLRSAWMVCVPPAAVVV
jgi:hypothetical protein